MPLVGGDNAAWGVLPLLVGPPQTTHQEPSKGSESRARSRRPA